MFNRRVSSNLGIHVYGLAGIALGVIGLVWGDFATVWQPIQSLGNVPHREALAYIAAVCLLLGGATLQWRRTAQAGAVLLAILYFICALFWVPRVIGYPRIVGTWSGFLEEFSLVAAAVIVYASLATRESARMVRTAKIGHLVFGICVLSFGLNHFFALPQTADMVPKWIPPGQQFLAAATGVAFLLASLAILSGVLSVLATRLLTVMLVIFGALVWAPALFAHPHEHTVWAGNAINLALVGAAWIVADSAASRHARRALRQEPEA